MEITTNNIKNISSNIYNWWTQDKSQTTLNKLSENQILGLANDINSVFSESTLSLPSLVVVGTQSSGKSSVLNSIIAMDILPTGKNMVTRTPLDIRLHNVKNINAWIEFGHYEDSWLVDKKIELTTPVPKIEEVNEIRNTIIQKTIEVAGSGMAISKTPIIIQIHSPNVPDLSLIDLPGLTMVACTDRGQPANIKEQIEELVTDYVKRPKTVIIAVMQARSDLETDLGLALIKRSDVDGSRTIGVLTKPDLMNYDTNIGEYLTNNISKNLMLSHGYYVVRNRSNQEATTLDIFGGLELEKTYFTKHTEYSKQIYRSRVGTANLTENLNKILVSSIVDALPSVMTEIFALDAELSQKLEMLGGDLPKTKEGKMSVLNKYVSNFSRQFIDSVESRGTLNVGKQLKDMFVKYRSDLLLIKPFSDKSKYDDLYFKNVVSLFEGNHMSFSTSPVQVIETCMTDPKLRPVHMLEQLSLLCVDQCSDLLINLLKQISKLDEFAKYPPLYNYIINNVTEQLISPLKLQSKNTVIKTLSYEEDYIWTDDKEFNEFLQKFTSEQFDTNRIVLLLDKYYDTVKMSVCNLVPKIVMSNVVKEIEKSLPSFLFQTTVVEQCLELLKEDEDVEKQRKQHSDLKERIANILKKNKQYKYEILERS